MYLHKLCISTLFLIISTSAWFPETKAQVENKTCFLVPKASNVDATCDHFFLDILKLEIAEHDNERKVLKAESDPSIQREMLPRIELGWAMAVTFHQQLMNSSITSCTPTEAALWKRRMLKSFTDEVTVVILEFWDRLSKAAQDTATERCGIVFQMFYDISIEERKCLGIDIQPFDLRDVCSSAARR